MNKYLNSLLIIFSIAFVSNAEAQCPPGYFSTPLTMNFNGCLIDVEICFAVHGLGGVAPIGEADIKSLTFRDASDPDCLSIDLSSSLFWDQVELRVIDYMVGRFEWYDLEVPPCDEPIGLHYTQISTTRANCWQINNHDPNPEVPGDEYSTLTVCNVSDPGKCTTLYRVCYEGETLVKTVDSKTSLSAPFCTDPIKYPITLNGMPNECFATCY